VPAQTPDSFSFDTTETITLSELAQCCGMSAQDLDELVDYSALVPVICTAPERIFSAHWVVPLRSAAKLRFDFDLDLFTVAIMLGHLNQIELLERQVQSLLALVPKQLRPPSVFQ
jgi:chaperone modulatory protein CbpM